MLLACGEGLNAASCSSSACFLFWEAKEMGIDDLLAEGAEELIPLNGFPAAGDELACEAFPDAAWDTVWGYCGELVNGSAGEDGAWDRWD